jgi:hypothetical protein
MCYNPAPSIIHFYRLKAVYGLLACTSALEMHCTLVALLPKQLWHEGQYYVTYKRPSSRKNL